MAPDRVKLANLSDRLAIRSKPVGHFIQARADKPGLVLGSLGAKVGNQGLNLLSRNLLSRRRLIMGRGRSSSLTFHAAQGLIRRILGLRRNHVRPASRGNPVKDRSRRRLGLCGALGARLPKGKALRGLLHNLGELVNACLRGGVLDSFRRIDREAHAPASGPKVSSRRQFLRRYAVQSVSEHPGFFRNARAKRAGRATQSAASHPSGHFKPGPFPARCLFSQFPSALACGGGNGGIGDD